MVYFRLFLCCVSFCSVSGLMLFWIMFQAVLVFCVVSCLWNVSCCFCCVFQAVFEPHALRTAYWKFLLRVTEGKWVTLRFVKYQIGSLARIIMRTTFSIKFRTRTDTRVPWNDTHDNHCHVLTCRWTLCKKWIIIWMFHLTSVTHLRHDHQLFVTGLLAWIYPCLITIEGLLMWLFVTGLLAWIAVFSTDSARSPPSCTPTTGRSTTLASHSCHQTQTCRPSTDDIAHTLVALRPGNWASSHDCCR